jgi:hypothetical protein
MRTAAASQCVLEIEIHMLAVRFLSDPNDKSHKVSVDSYRVEAGDAQHFFGGKLRCE